jgi:CRP-like cAMP-binding protein
MPNLTNPNQNQLLAALPTAEFERLRDALEPVAMRLGEVLYEPGIQMQYAYFPTTAVVSLHYVTITGASAQTAAVGREGMVGIALFMGGDSTASSAVVQTAGHGYRLSRSALLQAFGQDGQLRPLLLRYTQALLTQISQTAACYRHHSVEQQLSRWLLAAVDHTPQGELVITHELVAATLGVRRESITEAAGHLQAGGYIRYRRGHIQVLDAPGLVSRACECYGVVRGEQRRLQRVGQPAARALQAAA